MGAATLNAQLPYDLSRETSNEWYLTDRTDSSQPDRCNMTSDMSLTSKLVTRHLGTESKANVWETEDRPVV